MGHNYTLLETLEVEGFWIDKTLTVTKLVLKGIGT